MASIERDNIGTLHDKLTVSLTKEDYLPDFEKALKEFAKQANVPGFRKGKVPAAIIKKMQGTHIMAEQVSRSALQKVDEYIKEQQLRILGQPLMLHGDPLPAFDANKPEDFQIAFEIGVYPEFDIPAFNRAEPLVKYKITVPEDLVAQQIERLRLQYGQPDERTEVADDRDIIYASYVMCDPSGQPISSSTPADNVTVLPSFPQALRAMLQGKSAGDTLTFRPIDVASEEEMPFFLDKILNIPADFAEFFYLMKITKIVQMIPADVDAALFAAVFPDEYVADEDTFKARVQQDIAQEYDRRAWTRLNDEVVEMLIHTTHFDLPDDFLARWLKATSEKHITIEEAAQELAQTGHQMRWQLITGKIQQENNIQVTHDEITERMKAQVLAYFKMDAEDEPEWLHGYIHKLRGDNKAVEQTFNQLLNEKLFNHILSRFQIVEQEIDPAGFFNLPTPHEKYHHH